MSRNRIILGLALAIIVLLGVVVYHSYNGGGLDVDPHAAKEIEKAKGR